MRFGDFLAVLVDVLATKCERLRSMQAGSISMRFARLALASKPKLNIGSVMRKIRGSNLL